jgi:fumarate reductase subunit D
MDNLHFNEMIDGDVCFLLDQPVQLFLIVLAHWNNIPRVESWLHSNTIQILHMWCYKTDFILMTTVQWAIWDTFIVIFVCL